MIIIRASELTQTESSASVVFSDGEEKTFKAIICADGIHSLGKRTIFQVDLHILLILFAIICGKMSTGMQYIDIYNYRSVGTNREARSFRILRVLWLTEKVSCGNETRW